MKFRSSKQSSYILQLTVLIYTLPLTEEAVLGHSGDLLLEVLGAQAAQLLLLHHTRVATWLPTTRRPQVCLLTANTWIIKGQLHWGRRSTVCLAWSKDSNKYEH